MINYFEYENSKDNFYIGIYMYNIRLKFFLLSLTIDVSNRPFTFRRIKIPWNRNFRFRRKINDRCIVRKKKRKEKNRIPQYLFDIRAEKIEYCFEERKFEFNDPPVINNSTFDLSPPPIRAERFETLVRTRCKCNISVEQGEREREREKIA